MLNAPFEAGQVWAYRTRESETASRLTVCRVEPDAAVGQIVHLYLTKLSIANPAAPEGVTRIISHMPYSGEALRPCLTALERLADMLPPYQAGYQQWKASFDQGEAGVWTIAVADAVAAMETALNRDAASGETQDDAHADSPGEPPAA